jgi:hypothetical protein
MRDVPHTTRTSANSNAHDPAPLRKIADLRQFRMEPVREFARCSTAGEDRFPLRLADFARDHKINEASSRIRLRARRAVGVLLGFTTLGMAWAILTFA